MTWSSGTAAMKQRSAEPGRGAVRPGRELPADLVQVDLLPPEGEAPAAAGEGDRLHAQDPLVERQGAVDRGHGEDHVVQPVDSHRHDDKPLR